MTAVRVISHYSGIITSSWEHTTSATRCKAVVESLLGGSDLNSVGYSSFVRKASDGAWKEYEWELEQSWDG